MHKVKLTPKTRGENEPEVPYIIEWPSAIEAVENAVGAVLAPERWQTVTIETGHGALQALWDSDRGRWTMIAHAIASEFAAYSGEPVPQIMAEVRMSGGWMPCSCPACGSLRRQAVAS